VLKVMQREGFGADVVSGGELARALAAGMPARTSSSRASASSTGS
jgi:diaminopimelate decarboxylase